MEPTLMNQERIIVTRYDYIFGSPQRQDIVICHFPDGEDKDNYVKRIIDVYKRQAQRAVPRYRLYHAEKNIGRNSGPETYNSQKGSARPGGQP